MLCRYIKKSKFSSVSPKVGFITWYTATRSRILAKELKADLITMRYKPKARFIRLLSTPLIIGLTLLKLSRKNYDIVFAQIPPLGSALAGFLYSKIYSKKLIFDTHSGLFFPKCWHQNLYLLFYRIMLKYITMNLVHNEGILKRSTLNNTRTIVLEDRLPFKLLDSNLHPNRERFRIAVICGYGKDEPLQIILESIRLVPEVEFYLTGDSRVLKTKYFLPENIILTGHLIDDEYEKFLRTADAIMALTNRPDTVLCGAYEAVSLAKPLITSDLPMLRKYFSKGTIHATNDAHSIASAIRLLVNNYERLQNEMRELRKEKEIVWQEQFKPLKQLLS